MHIPSGYVNPSFTDIAYHVSVSTSLPETAVALMSLSLLKQLEEMKTSSEKVGYNFLTVAAAVGLSPGVVLKMLLLGE